MNRSRIVRFVFGAVLAAWATRAGALPQYYTDYCSACHGADPTTCNGCHSHGTHSNSSRSDINVVGALDRTEYAPGETMTVTVTGGYRVGWVRVVLFDENYVEQGRGSSAYPVTITVPAPMVPGQYNWSVAHYGNYQYETGGASFGLGIIDTLQIDYFTPDPRNSNHGFQTVALPTFTVRGTLPQSGVFVANLSPANETPPLDTGMAGLAVASVAVNSDGTSAALIIVSAFGFDTPITASHVHIGDPGVPGPVICTLTGSDFVNPVIRTCDFDAAQTAVLFQNGLYVNVHTEANPDGEIRDQLSLIQ